MLHVICHYMKIQGVEGKHMDVILLVILAGVLVTVAGVCFSRRQAQRLQQGMSHITPAAAMTGRSSSQGTTGISSGGRSRGAAAVTGMVVAGMAAAAYVAHRGTHGGAGIRQNDDAESDHLQSAEDDADDLDWFNNPAFSHMRGNIYYREDDDDSDSGLFVQGGNWMTDPTYSYMPGNIFYQDPCASNSISADDSSDFAAWGTDSGTANGIVDDSSSYYANDSAWSDSNDDCLAHDNSMDNNSSDSWTTSDDYSTSSTDDSWNSTTNDDWNSSTDDTWSTSSSDDWSSSSNDDWSSSSSDDNW